MLVIYRFDPIWKLGTTTTNTSPHLLQEGLSHILNRSTQRFMHPYLLTKVVESIITVNDASALAHRSLTVSEITDIDGVDVWQQQTEVRFGFLPCNLMEEQLWLYHCCQSFHELSVAALSDSKGISWGWHLLSCYFVETPSRTTGC